MARERITGVALRHGNTVVSKPYPSIHADLDSPGGDAESGFSTTHRAFVTREEAKIVADKSKQTYKTRVNRLGSEMLNPWAFRK